VWRFCQTGSWDGAAARFVTQSEQVKPGEGKASDRRCPSFVTETVTAQGSAGGAVVPANFCLAKKLDEMGFKSYVADPDAWMRGQLANQMVRNVMSMC
jgi:hypothetical protein